MRIDSIDKRNFKGALNNKLLLGSLEKIADHSATFLASTSLLMSLTLRPIAIKNTPKVKNNNKKYSIANSITSGVAKFLTVEAIALPLEHAIITLEKNKDCFLDKNSIALFKKSPEIFGFLAQLLKQSTSLLSSVPKSLLSVYFIPIVFDKLLNNNKKQKPQKSVSFKGNLNNILAKNISGFFNNNKLQKFALNNIQNSKNITRNLIAANDVILTGVTSFGILKNKKIKEKNKNNLIYNNIISTAFSVISGCILDKFVQNKSGKFIEAFKTANKNNPKLEKYIQGINVARPAIIFALIYYGILPVVSNFLAQKISDKQDKNK